MSAKDGGPAFPGPAYIHGRGNCQPVVFPDGSFEWQEMAPGMSLRDWFATTTPTDEIESMTYKHLSLQAQEKLAGMKKPLNDSTVRGDEAIEKQIQLMRFQAAVNAALRYISADAMLAARKQKEVEL